MPEAYTHVRIARAALRSRGVETPQTAAYETGANGPDPLFVAIGGKPNLVREMGIRLHKEKCGLFLQALAHYAKTAAQRAYVMGFVAHYAADGVLHPYVKACTEPGMPFCKQGGHGYCEVAMDTMFHEADTSVRGVPADDAAPRLAADALAEICLLMRRALQDVFGVQVPLTQLSDAYRIFRFTHRFCYAPRGGKKAVAWLLDNTVARGTDYVQSHMTPCKAPREGFPEAWKHPYTGQDVKAGPHALCLHATELCVNYQNALTQFWGGTISAGALAAAIGSNSYETGQRVSNRPEAAVTQEPTVSEDTPAQAAVATQESVPPHDSAVEQPQETVQEADVTDAQDATAAETTQDAQA